MLNSLDKPFFDNEDLALMESFADLAAVAIIRSRLLEQRIEQERLRAELNAAAEIQKLFWPKMPELGEGSHVWAFSEPAASVGGDLYDVIPMPDPKMPWVFWHSYWSRKLNNKVSGPYGDRPRNTHPEYWKRKVIRPDYEILCGDIKALGYVGAGKKYGVSDNAIRKWKKHYERQFEN